MSEDVKERILELENQITRSPDCEAYFPLAKLYQQSGEFRKAFDLCVYGLKRFPKSFEGYMVLGNILYEQFRYDGAEKAFATAFKIDPSSSEPLFLLCEVYKKNLKLSKLSAVLHQLEIVAPYDPRLKEIRDKIKELKQSLRSQDFSKPFSQVQKPKETPPPPAEVEQSEPVEIMPEPAQSPQPKTTQEPKPTKEDEEKERILEKLRSRKPVDDAKQQVKEPKASKGANFEEFLDKVFALDDINGVVFLDDKGNVNRSMDCDADVAKALAKILLAHKKAFDISFKALHFGEWAISSVFMEFSFVLLVNLGKYKIALNCDPDAPYGPTRVRVNSIIKSCSN